MSEVQNSLAELKAWADYWKTFAAKHELRLLALVIEPVESSHLVGAIIGAVPGSHAPVVDLRVQTFGVMVGRVNRAD